MNEGEITTIEDPPPFKKKKKILKTLSSVMSAKSKDISDQNVLH